MGGFKAVIPAIPHGLDDLSDADLFGSDLEVNAKAVTADLRKTFASGAVRNSAGKLRYDLIPFEHTREMAKVLTVGADKYSMRFDHPWDSLLFLVPGVVKISAFVHGHSVVAVMKNSCGDLSLSLPDDKGNNLEIGIKKTLIGSVKSADVDGLVRNAEKGTKTQSDRRGYVSSGLLKNFYRYTAIEDVVSAAGMSTLIQTMTIQRDGLEEYFVAAATTVLECSEILLKESKKLFNISNGATVWSAPGDHNWERGLPYSEVYASLMRHLHLWLEGETHDKESGLLHLSHAAWNVMVLETMALRGKDNELDDITINAARTEV